MSSKEENGSPRARGSIVKSLVLFVLVAVAIGLIGTVFMIQAQQGARDKAFLGLVGQLRQDSLSLVTDSIEAASGLPQAFSRLRATRERIEVGVLALRAGERAAGGIGGSSSTLEVAAGDLDSAWQRARSHADRILAGQEAVESANDLVAAIVETIPEIQIRSDDVAVALIQSGATSNEVYIATRQLLLLQRLENNVARLVGGGVESASAADRFGRDLALFAKVHEAMLRGDASLGIERIGSPSGVAALNEISALFAGVEEAAGQLLGKSPDLFQVVSASQDIIPTAGLLRGAVEELAQRYSYLADPRGDLAFLFGILAAALLAGVAVWQIIEARAQARESDSRKLEIVDQNERNQEAILKLLDEMGDLADGDLSVRASVTEDLTGAIADSVNYAVEALRELVVTIHRTSEQVASASVETRQIAERLKGATSTQTEQITSAATSVDTMTRSMSDMSANAAASADVATNSVQIASQGGDRVRRTIQGMDVIREHIQETAKRIKRLGESSQEIGDIVGLINDIAEQTNILALNAAIQAAAAGEAGRGFGVVADEVQRLAERAANSTKRIEQLVKTIQADTSEAVLSMEKSTAEVVNGAELAERAGESLEEIEGVSNRLAELINNISRAAREQAEVASSVAGTMATINGLTEETSEGTERTATAISDLTQMAEDLRRSVAGFKLPAGALK
jgi:twitching motility protein PilJ